MASMSSATVLPLLKHFRGNRRNSIPENRLDLLGRERGEPLDNKTHDQQQFDALGQPIGQRADEAEPSVEKIGKAKGD